MAMWHSLKELFVRSATPPRSASAPIGKNEAPHRSTPARADHNKRRAVRKAQRFAEGFIWSDRMAASKVCNIRDLSVSGARVDLLNATISQQTLRGMLTLYLPAEKREIDCKLKWRAGNRIGLEFVGRFRVPTRQYGSRSG